MITPTEAQKLARENLVGFPPGLIDDYLAFAASGDEAKLDLVVLGILQFYLPKKSAEPLAMRPGTTRLVEDLGCDSLTMMDTVFMTETLLAVKIDDAELMRIATLDELRGHLRRLVKDGAPAAT